MQTTSALYQQIIADDNHWFESKVQIQNNNSGYYELSESDIKYITVSGAAFPDETPTVGNAVSGRIDIELYGNYDIPKRAEIKVFTRVVREVQNGTQSSEWIPKGTFYTDTRSFSANNAVISVTSLSGFDALILTDQDYPDTEHNWPYYDIHVVQEIASTIGVTVDSRTIGFLTSRYSINLPSGYTMRETLQNIAALYGGNFVMTDSNTLLFVPLYGLDPDITGYYLADGDGTTALMMGDEGWFILV